ncbi:MAG: zf-HC2 domain-containing protein [Candidatus Aminicenantes bacterium]|nr:zf-HC2 domain-containing protein [Candidatus Aminicenantes bacterium]
MDCKLVEERISNYIENNLSATEMDAVREHIQSCGACRDLLERMERVLYLCEDLTEEVPFFLKNRLYNIAETRVAEEPAISGRTITVLKWAAAMVGTAVLLLNLLYFTSIVPPANRFLHLAVSRIETFVVEAGAYVERISESDRNPFLGLFMSPDKKIDADQPFPDGATNEGGKNG